MQRLTLQLNKSRLCCNLSSLQLLLSSNREHTYSHRYFCKFYNHQQHHHGLVLYRPFTTQQQDEEHQQHTPPSPGPLDKDTSKPNTYPLPWPLYSTPLASREPILDRLVGKFLIRSVAKKFGHNFSNVEFLHGVSDAVRSFADILADKSRHAELEHVLSPVLFTAVTKSLQTLPSNSRIHAQVDSVRGAYICGIQSIFGDAEPGDRHIVSWLGQTVVASKSKLESLFMNDGKFTFNSAQDMGKEAALTRLEFQLGVSFMTSEKFFVVDCESDKVILGSEDFRSCYHFWKFRSFVDWESDDREYPFDWLIADINNHVTDIGLL